MARRRITVFGLLLVAGAVIAAVLGGGDDPRRTLDVTVGKATNLYPGVVIRAAGQKVGRIDAVEPTGDGRARLRLRIDDDRVWPLYEDDVFRVRYGGTIAFAARYVAIERGTDRVRPLADGARLPRDRFVLPVEIDEVLGTFDRRTRANLGTFTEAAGAAMLRARPGLERTLDEAPSALAQARAVLRDVGADEVTLGRLVRSGDNVAAAIDRSEPGVTELIDGARSTFAAIGGRAQRVQTMLREMPATLTTATSTLERADGTLERAETVVGRLRPGVGELRRIARPLSRTLTALDDAAPDARSTVATLRKGAPDVTKLLRTATGLAPRLADVGREAARQLECVRPYTGEIAGFASTWGQVSSNSDGRDKFARITLQAYPFGTFTPLTNPQLNKVFPSTQVQYAFPRPPGMNANQTWYIPKCGVGPDATDPTKDPEAIAFSPLSKNVLEIDDDAEFRP